MLILLFETGQNPISVKAGDVDRCFYFTWFKINNGQGNQMKSRLIFIVGWVLVLSSFAGAQADFHWVEYGANPVFGQAAGGPKAYYPSVCFDAEEFSDHGIRAKYKMWYGSASGQVGLAWSDDGIIWNDAGQVVGNVHYHCKVLYDAAGFGSGIYYKMWYADPGVWPYSKQTIRYAESMDGFTW